MGVRVVLAAMRMVAVPVARAVRKAVSLSQIVVGKCAQMDCAVQKMLAHVHPVVSVQSQAPNVVMMVALLLPQNVVPMSLNAVPRRKSVEGSVSNLQKSAVQMERLPFLEPVANAHVV